MKKTICLLMLFIASTAFAQDQEVHVARLNAPRGFGRAYEIVKSSCRAARPRTRSARWRALSVPGEY